MIKPQDITGFFHPGDFDAIRCLTARLNPQATIVEVGSHFGRSTAGWADSLPHGTIWAIDSWHKLVNHTPWDNRMAAIDSLPQPIDQANLNRQEVFEYFTRDRTNIRAIRAVSPLTTQIRSQITQPIDLVFIDSRHSNPWFSRDLNYWYDQVPSGSYITGHDYHTNFPDIINTLTKFCAEHNIEFELFDNSSIWAFKKP